MVLGSKKKSQSLSLYLTKCILASSWFFICLPVYLYFVLFVCQAAACFPLQLPSSLFVRMNMKMLKAFPPFFNPKTKKYLGRPCTLGFPSLFGNLSHVLLLGLKPRHGEMGIPGFSILQSPNEKGSSS